MVLMGEKPTGLGGDRSVEKKDVSETCSVLTDFDKGWSLTHTPPLVGVLGGFFFRPVRVGICTTWLEMFADGIARLANSS